MRPEIYLDWNSTTPMADEVVQAMMSQRQALWGNPASVHGVGRRARHVLEQTRELLAELFAFQARDVLLTCGGTEANNLALHAADVLLLSRLEHPSIIRVAERLEREGKRVIWMETPANGYVSAGVVERALASLSASEQARATVALMAANHETGVLQPIEAVARVVRAARARLHVDAVQLVGKAEHTALGGADSVSLTAHKIRGPKGIGALLFRGAPPTPLMLGGAQERGLRPGTQDAWLALGFKVALERARSSAERWASLSLLRDHLEERLTPIGERNVSDVERLPHVTSLTFAAMPGPELVAALDLEGICVASGSACSAGTEEPSPVIAAMLGTQRARHTLRISLGENTTAEQIDTVIQALFRILDSSAAARTRA